MDGKQKDQKVALNIQPIRNLRKAQQDLNAAARDLADYLISNGQVGLAAEEYELIEAVRELDAQERARQVEARNA